MGPLMLTDYYRVYPPDGFGDGYYLVCKLSCKGDVKIENIKSIRWSDRIIIVEKSSDEEEWYIVVPKGNKLMCCNRDSLVGPLSEGEVMRFLGSDNDMSLLKVKVFEKK